VGVGPINTWLVQYGCRFCLLVNLYEGVPLAILQTLDFRYYSDISDIKLVLDMGVIKWRAIVVATVDVLLDHSESLR